MKRSYLTAIFGIVTLVFLVFSANKGYRTLENHRSEILNLTKDLQLLDNSIKSFETNLNSLRTDVQSMKTTLDALNGKVTGENDDISTLRQTIHEYGSQAVSLSLFNQKIENIESSLSTAESRYKELKETFNKVTTQQAALIASENLEKVDLGRVVVTPSKEQ